MKEQNVKFELKEDSVEQKRSYEKPLLNTVSLFADQVLGSCLGSLGSDCADGPSLAG